MGFLTGKRLLITGVLSSRSIAYGIARAPRTLRLLLLVLVILPFWTSSLLRTYAMIGMLKANGLISQGLAAVGLVEPTQDPQHTYEPLTAVRGGHVGHYGPAPVEFGLDHLRVLGLLGQCVHPLFLCWHCIFLLSYLAPPPPPPAAAQHAPDTRAV